MPAPRWTLFSPGTTGRACSMDVSAATTETMEDWFRPGRNFTRMSVGSYMDGSTVNPFSDSTDAVLGSVRSSSCSQRGEIGLTGRARRLRRGRDLDELTMSPRRRNDGIPGWLRTAYVTARCGSLWHRHRPPRNC